MLMLNGRLNLGVIPGSAAADRRGFQGWQSGRMGAKPVTGSPPTGKLSDMVDPRAIGVVVS